MVKRLVTVAATAAAFMVGGPALAADLIIEEAAPVAVTGSSDWYVSLFAGGVWSNFDVNYNGNDPSTIDFDTGYNLGIAVGTHVFDNLRGEIELSGGTSSATDYEYDSGSTGVAEGDLTTVYLLGNLWYELDVGGSVKPYIGGGIGAGFASSEIYYDNDDYGPGGDAVGLAYQIGAGVTFDVAEGVALDVGYRYKSIVGLEFDDLDGSGIYEDGSVHSHVVQAGVKFSF
jgi:opacity protein-like surface antigen